MVENTELCAQADFLYRAAAKQLYTIALYSTGNENAAKEITINAFVSSFYRIEDRSNPDLFLLLSMRELYRQVRKERIRSFFSLSLRKNNSVYRAYGKPSSLIIVISNLSYLERFVLLMSCWQRFSICRIAHIVRLPVFVIRRILFTAVKKAVKQLNKDSIYL